MPSWAARRRAIASIVAATVAGASVVVPADVNEVPAERAKFVVAQLVESFGPNAEMELSAVPLNAQQQCRAGEVEPADHCAVGSMYHVLADPRGQVDPRDASFDEALEPRVGDAASALATVEEFAAHPCS